MLPPDSPVRYRDTELRVIAAALQQASFRPFDRQAQRRYAVCSTEHKAVACLGRDVDRRVNMVIYPDIVLAFAINAVNDYERAVSKAPFPLMQRASGKTVIAVMHGRKTGGRTWY